MTTTLCTTNMIADIEDKSFEASESRKREDQELLRFDIDEKMIESPNIIERSGR